VQLLEDNAFERVGERPDVRIIAATRDDMDSDLATGKIRPDLFHRLSVLDLRVPPLCERREDILPLARRFLEFFAHRAKRSPLALSAELEAALVSYRWPGNVRQLRNAIERAVILWPGRVIELAALSELFSALERDPPWLGGDYSIDVIEREHIRRVVANTRTLEQAAGVLGVDVTTLWRRHKREQVADQLGGGVDGDRSGGKG
jgi:NtrC-family two-component system response regulator AlgB